MKMSNMRIINKMLIFISLSAIILVPASSADIFNLNLSDIDPLIDISITVEILQIRSLEKIDRHIPAIEIIDLFGDPDFYVKIFINEEEFVSPIYHNTKYIYNPEWSATLNVPDEEEWVDIRIELWDWNANGDKQCDISPFDYDFPDDYGIDIYYNIETGHWDGDDYYYYESSWFDPSGYGRLNGCDDGSIYQIDRDCEILFDIYQNDYDNDGLPYWSEVEVYGTDPTKADTGDPDNDGVSIQWEHKWGHLFGRHGSHYWIYDPFEWDDHENLDYDEDALSNVDEYLLSEWGADPYRKDVFVELDIMESSPEGDITYFPERSKELLYTTFNRQNVVLHLDDGSMGGSDIIPFDDRTSGSELENIYWIYFLNEDVNNSRRGVFHYGVMVYNATGASGYIFRPDGYQISIKGMEEKARNPILNRDVVYASAYMHELGHTFAFSPIPGHSEDCYYPWQIGWWQTRSYKSIMNYGYMYYIVDYSDGSHGKNDFDDWERMDFTYIQRYWG
jgi:hypothetical protein